MILVFEHLHGKDIIYREFVFVVYLVMFFSLKPENVLIDEKGYIRITDFGLSRRNIKGKFQAKTICGTPEYLAPEIVFKMGHGKPVDW
jgi:serum/glucocorticoid-regulated kinase 2